MKKLKILNLYSGIGGNRHLWKGCEVTAVENNETLLNFYARNYPKDKVVLGDAHEYLLRNYSRFDFIWASPPCVTHSKLVWYGSGPKRYPDFRLYEEVVFLLHHFKGRFCVENVIPYYEPLIKGIEMSNHIFWTNYNVQPIGISFWKGGGKIREKERVSARVKWLQLPNLNSKEFPRMRFRQIVDNTIHPELGLHLFKQAKL